MSAPAIEVRGLRKAYGDRIAVDGIDLTVPAASCVGILGPNGAGKTTTLRILTCLATRDAGDVRVLGHDPQHAPRRVKAGMGVVTQDDTLDLELTVEENLAVFARYHGMRDADAVSRTIFLLQMMELTSRRAERVERLSGGMRRRLQIARALVAEPRIVVLDEPTTGLDPQARHAVWDRLGALRERGVTILLTTHYMEEAAELCDTVAIMTGGRIVARGNPARLVGDVVGDWAGTLRSDEPDRVVDVARAAGLIAQRVDARRAVVFASSRESLEDFAGDRPLESLRPSSLEDVFLELTGRTLGETEG